MVLDVRRFDIYRKIPKDLTQPTYTGAIISICCCVCIAFLFLSELYGFISPEIASELYVDNPGSSDEKIFVRLNISMPRLSCDVVGLDIQDELGRHEVGFVENIEKKPLPNNGCLFYGRFYINKVPGNFHVSTHSADKQPEEIDMSHIIHEVTFGEEIKNPNIPGNFNALAGRDKLEESTVDSHDYIMKIVPTVYEQLSGAKVFTYQYTYAYRNYISFSLSGRAIPAIWFRYDLSPITVKYHEKTQPLYTFLTAICAIIGGIFTVASIIDSCIFTVTEKFRKAELKK